VESAESTLWKAKSRPVDLPGPITDNYFKKSLDVYGSNLLCISAPKRLTGIVNKNIFSVLIERYNKLLTLFNNDISLVSLSPEQYHEKMFLESKMSVSFYQ